MSVLQPEISQYTGVNLLAAIVTTSGIQESDGAVIGGKTDGDLEDEKKAIYSHPLFPLLVLLFEKCEQASQSADCPSSDSFDIDIQSFVQRQEKDRKPFFSEDPDLDNLMVKAIQVLRIHLLELEKVNDLCKDFCNRYINCLRGKLQSEQLLKVESDFDDSDVGSPPPNSATSKNVPIAPLITSTASNVMLQQTLSPATAQMPQLGPGQIMSGGTIYQMVHTPQGLVAQPIQFQSSQMSTNPVQIHGSTPMSQIGVNSVPAPPSTVPPMSTLTGHLSSDEEDGSDKKKSKRGVLPKSATQVMKSWLFQHIVHPYPTEDEKRQIATQTNLTLLQVNNWFINARRRILQPMLEASNPEQVKTKKSKPQTRPLQRFWPESLANLQPQISPAFTSVAPIQSHSADDTTTLKDLNSNSEKNDNPDTIIVPQLSSPVHVVGNENLTIDDNS